MNFLKSTLSVQLLQMLLAFALVLPQPALASGIWNMNAMWRRQNVEVSWLGGKVSFTGAWASGVGTSSGTSDGLLKVPNNMVVDAGGNMYVSDQSNHRISKYNATTGAFIGWIGRISSSPTGGAAGCNGAAADSFTPGWCTGGSGKAGADDGMLNNPLNVFVDTSGNLYVADTSNHRISKYNASTGAFIGWIGRINTSPTGGALGCNGAAVDSFTPGWCTGGSGKSGSGDGMMNAPNGVTVDASGNLYVADFTNHRIGKYTASTGAFIGWIGKINAVATGGAAGCDTALTDTFTPGWCTGGTAKSGNGDGMMNNPNSLQVVGTILYVEDTANHRIQKFTASTGAFLGWIGNINASPTGGDAGCNGAATSTFTPGWCTGGTGKSGSGNGMMNLPYGIFIDSGSDKLYVADYNNHRINKYTASTGAFVGWIGNINASPTGGDAGCNGAATSTFTPGWCTGGTAKLGTGDGMMRGPNGVFVDSGGKLYVAEYDNHRISKYTASSGAFIGAIGGVTTATPWTSDPVLRPGADTAKDGIFSMTMAATPYGGSLYVSDNTHRISRFDLTTGAFTGWIGKIATSPTGGDPGCAGAAVGTATPGWCTGGSSVNGSGDGHFYQAYHMMIRAGGVMYVTEAANHRVSRYNVTTGAFTGWIGKIGSSPTGGDPGCNGAAVGTFTPGWCLGGSASSGTAGDGSMNAPHSADFDGSGFMYVSDHSNHRVNKYVAATGAFVGWIGKVGTSPTGGETGCAGAAVGTATPGWCVGGTPATGTGDGMFNVTSTAFLDSSGKLYVGDNLNRRIQKFDAATGAFIGWIGKINTSPTGGAAGCNGAAIDTFTPGWCVGGTSKSGTGDGDLSNLEGIHVDSAGDIYVADYSNSRISKYKASTGTFLGWIGYVKTVPTGGAAACNGAAINTFTPSWCVGGTSKSGTGLGHLQGPLSTYSDGAGTLYVVDFLNNRITRYKFRSP